MRDRKINLQDLSVGNLLRVVGDLNRLGMASLFCADHLVVGRLLCATGISGDRPTNTLEVLKHPLDAPEATAGQDDGLRSGAGRYRHIERRCRYGHGWLGRLRQRGLRKNKDGRESYGSKHSIKECAARQAQTR